VTLRDALADASKRIPRRNAETLLAHVLERDRAWILAHGEDELATEQLAELRELVERRALGVPVQHLTGTQEFFGLAMRVTPDVLIPRPETEHLVEAVRDWAHARTKRDPGWNEVLRIADVGSGSGAIAIALAAVLEKADVTAIDLSPAALAVARENAARHGVENRIRFVQGDLLGPFAAQDGGLDVVASNPPYVGLADRDTLAVEVRDHEPALALFAGPDGLDVYRRLIPKARAALRSGGLLAMEFGFGQQEALAALLEDWREVRFIDDYAAIPRVVLATRP
jgi:release factor glutamine methyltransferase